MRGHNAFLVFGGKIAVSKIPLILCHTELMCGSLTSANEIGIGKGHGHLAHHAAINEVILRAHDLKEVLVHVVGVVVLMRDAKSR